MNVRFLPRHMALQKQSTTARLLMRLGICATMRSARTTVLIACAVLLLAAGAVAVYAQSRATTPEEFTERFEAIDQRQFRTAR